MTLPTARHAGLSSPPASSDTQDTMPGLTAGASSSSPSRSPLSLASPLSPSRSVSLTPPPRANGNGHARSGTAKGRSKVSVMIVKPAPGAKANANGKNTNGKRKPTTDEEVDELDEEDEGEDEERLPTKAAARNKKAKLDTAASAPAPAKSKAKAKPTAKAQPAKKDEPETKAARERGTYCHQCRRECDPDNVLRCTRMRKYTKATPARACNLAWCLRDLEKRYEIDYEGIVERGRRGVSAEELAAHDTDKAYVFSCPCCLDECQNATCRKKKGLEPLGDIVKIAAKTGQTLAEIVSKTDEGVKPTGKARTSMTVAEALAGAAGEGEEDELSDLPEAKAEAKPKKKRASAANGASKATKAASTAAKPAAKAKGKADAKAGTAKTAATKEKGAKSKATPKGAPAAKEEPKPKKPKAEVKKEPVEPPVDPPMFEKVDTRLSKEEAEQRMYLREFVWRFRTTLSIPERSLGPLDNFDSPLTEAAVRQLAGAMVDLIREELEDAYGETDLVEQLRQNREELRYYADLARFATIFNSIAEPLGLHLPPAAETQREQNDRAMRKLLDLDPRDATPTWADAGPSRRAGASRVPLPAEVIRMLLALVQRVIDVPRVRAEMDPGTMEFEARRRLTENTRALKVEWDEEKKEILAERAKLKTKADKEASKKKLEDAQHNHAMKTQLLNINLRATLARKLLRFEPLGTDLDGRTYYVLTPRLIDDHSRPPIGWASGLLVWGPGVDVPGSEAESLPPMIERWSHFGRSKDVRQLEQWLSWRARQRVSELEAQAAQAAKATKSKGKPKANGASGSKANANGTQKVNGTTMPKPNAKPKTKSRSASATAMDIDEVSDAESDLSSAPVDSSEELLALLDPVGYEASAETVKDAQADLVQKIHEVVGWLAILEWKGMGEV